MSGNQAWIINAVTGAPSYVANDIRQLMANLVANGTSRVLGGRSGYLPGRQPATLSITGTSPTFSYSVSAFGAIIDPAFTATQAPYLAKTDAANTGSITAPNGSNPRKDVVYAQVQENAIDGSGQLRLFVGITTGTPAASPAEPSPPAGAFALAVISVPVLGGGTPTIAVKNTFTVAAGGIVPVDLAAPLIAGTTIPTPYAGMSAYAMDTKNLYVYDGAAWVLGGVNDTGWIDVVAGIGFNAPWTTYVIAPQYRRIGNRVNHRGGAQGGSSGTSAYTVPVGFRPTQNMAFDCPNGGGVLNFSTKVTVGSNGVIQPESATYGVLLDQISYLTD